MTLPVALDRALKFTDLYRACSELPVPLREARCLAASIPDCLRPIEAEDLLAGRFEIPLVGVSPEPGGLGYYCRCDAVATAAQSLAPAEMARVDTMLAFWRTECTAAKVRAAFPAPLQALLPSDDWTGRPGVAFPLYRMALACPDYGRLVRRGIAGLAADVRAVRERHSVEAQALDDAFLLALEVLADAASRYRDQALQQAGHAESPRREELLRLAGALDAIVARAPASFLEAAELVWLTALVSGTLNFGRMDEYLGDFYARDVDSGALTAARAQAIVESLWRLMAARHTVFNGRVIVGGVGRPNEANADRFALAAIEATRTVRGIEPQLSLRFHRAQDPELYRRALDVLGEGATLPILYNDDVNVPAVASAFDVPLDVAADYVPHGCGEYVLAHRSFHTPSGVVNLLQALLVTLRRDTYASFDALWSAYCSEVERHVRACADQQALEYAVVGRELACLLPSLLYDACLVRGRALFDGGIAHLGGTLETYGNINVSDSLTAIDALVFAGTVPLDELVRALDADFSGHDRLRRELCARPKYGNDDPLADGMARRVHEHVCRAARDQRERTPLDSYLVVIVNNDANTTLGRHTGASPDGRHAGESLANGNNPSPGADRSGVTAFLNSLVQLTPALHAGAVQNMKFSPELFRSQRPNVEALLDTYFARGGTQAMITVVGRGDLEAALLEPEKYGHLLVRVGGFSARFVELPRAVQLDILRRTLNG